MPLLADRVLETSITAGTGTLTLAGAVSGYRSFNSAFTNGNIVFYTVDDGAGNWEVGYGTIGTGTLTRTTVLESSNANALVVFSSASKRVYCTAPTPALLPDQTSQSGKVLTTNGTTPSWTTPNAGTVTSVTGTAPIVSSGGATPAISIPAATSSVNGYLTSTDWTTFNGKGSGSVTTVSVVSTNGFTGTVANATTTPAITITTSITGVLKGNGTAISAATSGTDYSVGTSALATGILKSTTTTGALSIAVAGTDYQTAQSVTGIVKSSGTTRSAATAGTDYVAPGGALGTPSSGTLTNCTFPTLNQNTSGTAAGLSATLAVASGGTGVTTSTGTGSTVLSTSPALTTPTWNNAAPNITSTASTGIITTLTSSSSYYQRITGTLAQTIKLPDETTIPAGTTYVIDNDSTQSITITDSAGSVLATGVSGAAGLFYSMSNATATGNWGGYAYLPASVQWGSGALGAAYGGTGVTAAGTSGNVLTSNGTAWVSQAPAASGISTGKAIAMALIFGF